MTANSQRAVVHLGNKRAGTLTRTEIGFEFAYDADFLMDPHARPISLSLSLRREPYKSPKLFAFFEGLLPEGWLLELICVTARIDENDSFRLLLHTGRDPVGAVSIMPAEGDDRA